VTVARNPDRTLWLGETVVMYTAASGEERPDHAGLYLYRLPPPID